MQEANLSNLTMGTVEIQTVRPRNIYVILSERTVDRIGRWSNVHLMEITEFILYDANGCPVTNRIPTTVQVGYCVVGDVGRNG